jgi:hypothetical protein
MMLARSTDSGRSFDTVELARVYDDLDCYPLFAGRQTLTDMHFRINSYPSMSVDQITGKIAIVWTDDQGAGNCGSGAASFSGTTSNQVKLVTGHWPSIATAGVTALTTSAPDKVFPTVASANGKAAASYYTRDYAITSTAAICNVRTNSNPTGVAPEPTARSVCLDYAGKSDGGLGFGSQRRLSTESSNPFVQFADGGFIGDYTQIAITPNGSKAYAAWTDFRGRPGVTPANQDVMVESLIP